MMRDGQLDKKLRDFVGSGQNEIIVGVLHLTA